MFAPLDKHSIPKEPTPENKSKIFEFLKLILNLFEWLIILKIDSFVKSFKGLVFLSFGSNNFFPFKISRNYSHFFNNFITNIFSIKTIFPI